MKNVQTQTSGSLPPASAMVKKSYCILCRRLYLSCDAQEHVHCMFHHTQLEAVVGKGAVHTCQACNTVAMDLNDYRLHILTAKHQAKLQSLKTRNVKPVALEKSLSPETMKQIIRRNKQLKLQEKKTTKKTKKKKKQVASQQRAEQQSTAIKKPNVGSNSVGTKFSVVQNNESSAAPLHSPFLPAGPYLQDESRRFVCPPAGPPEGHSWRWPHFQGRFPPRSHLIRSYEECTRDKNFTSDHLPQSGVIIFDDNPGTSKSVQEHLTSSDQPAPANQPANKAANKPANQLAKQPANQLASQPADQLGNQPVDTAPQSYSDVNVMLKMIRSTLGVREPCRADREARRQNREGSLTPANDRVTQRVGATENHSTPAPTTCSHPPAASSEQTTHVSRKVRIAHKPSKAHIEGGARLKPSQNLLLSLSAKSKSSWTLFNKEAKNKGKTKCLQRSRFQMINHPTKQQKLAQLEISDLPLSEGFHWESLAGPPLDPHFILPPPPKAATHTDHHTEAESDCPIVEDLDPPASAQESCSSRTVSGHTVKVEWSSRDKNGEIGDTGQATKRKHNSVTDDVCETMSRGKRKKKSNNAAPDQNPMDQLLTVSLREEGLSNTLQQLDGSLIQARNALQAAYAEVQRVMLLKQQCAVEVNALRAKRIEILQGMQGLSAASNASETASTSSAGAPAPVQSSSPPAATAASSTQTTPAASPASWSLQIQPGPQAVSMKKEMCHLPTAGQSHHNVDAQLLSSLRLTPSHVASHKAQQPSTEGSTSTNKTPPESSAAREERNKDFGENLEGRSQPAQVVEGKEGNLSTEQKSERKVTEQSAPGKKGSKDDTGNESDASVEVIGSSDTEVIAIDESDCEESPEANSKAPAEPDQPEKSEDVNFTSSSSQTAQQSEDKSKFDSPAVKVKDPSDCAERAEEEEQQQQQPSEGAFFGHTGPVHSLQIHDGLLYTCSGDNTARAFCLQTRECKAVFKGHTNKINCLLVSNRPNLPPRLYTGASDQTICSFSLKTTKCLDQIALPDRVFCLHVSWNILYAGLANGSVCSFDLKTLKELDVFECHGPRAVSCLGTAQEGVRRLLLVGSYDSTISVRDAKNGLLLRTLEGHSKTVLCMKVVDTLVFSGSSDTSVHAHNIHTGELVHIYKGHGHAVTSIVILGKVMVTACLDKLVRIYELQSHDRLQVYGGHSDMVMCMAVHKSLIYTGCYDGSVQAAQLNLMKNYRCWWHNCSMIFGIAEHLVQHLTGDHTSPSRPLVKCCWRGCNTVFGTQQLVEQKLPEHMQKHVENDSSVQP